jgi:hypothetical protein
MKFLQSAALPTFRNRQAIHFDVRLHPEIPLVALLGLTHFSTWLAELTLLLQEVDPQHHRHQTGSANFAGLAIMRRDQPGQIRPWRDNVHTSKQPIALRLFLFFAVTKRRKARIARGMATQESVRRVAMLRGYRFMF